MGLRHCAENPRICFANPHRLRSAAAALARSCALQCAKLVGARRYESAHTSTTSALVRRACAYIDHHIYEKTDIRTMARRLKVSEGYLSRTFHEGKGMTLLEYAHQKKIHLATTLLTGSDKSLQEIADLLEVPLATVLSKYHRALKKLNNRLKGDGAQ